MKHRLVILGLCLLAGAVVNVLVAWACVPIDPDWEPWPITNAGGEWHITVPSDWPARAEDINGADSTFATLRVADWGFFPGLYNHSTDWSDEDQAEFDRRESLGLVRVWTFEYGYPLRSLRFSRETRTKQFRRSDLLTGRSALIYGGYHHDSWDRWTAVPLDPMWAGFAANTLIYGGVFWVPLIGLSAARRARRGRRGRCISCGYTLDDLPTCPECGSAR